MLCPNFALRILSARMAPYAKMQLRGEEDLVQDETDISDRGERNAGEKSDGCSPFLFFQG